MSAIAGNRGRTTEGIPEAPALIAGPTNPRLTRKDGDIRTRHPRPLIRSSDRAAPGPTSPVSGGQPTSQSRRQGRKSSVRHSKLFSLRFHRFSLTAPWHRRLQTLRDVRPANCPPVVADGGVFSGTRLQNQRGDRPTQVSVLPGDHGHHVPPSRPICRTVGKRLSLFPGAPSRGA